MTHIKLFFSIVLLFLVVSLIPLTATWSWS